MKVLNNTNIYFSIGSTIFVKPRIFYFLLSHTFAIPSAFPNAEIDKRVLMSAKK